jgi:hypothetical protein
MTDTGLSNRLRQHSRRSGIAVGLTMAVTIAVCILSSAYVFGKIEPYVAEVTGYDEPTAVPEVAEEPDSEEQPTEEEEGSEESAPQQEEGAGQPTIGSSDPTATSSTFTATHRSNPDFTVNFRPGPSVSSGDPIGTLDPSTPLQFMEQEALDEEGVVWLEMQTEGGLTGWLREVDTEAIIQ